MVKKLIKIRTAPIMLENSPTYYSFQHFSKSFSIILYNTTYYYQIILLNSAHK